MVKQRHHQTLSCHFFVSSNHDFLFVWWYKEAIRINHAIFLFSAILRSKEEAMVESESEEEEDMDADDKGSDVVSYK